MAGQRCLQDPTRQGESTVRIYVTLEYRAKVYVILLLNVLFSFLVPKGCKTKIVQFDRYLRETHRLNKSLEGICLLNIRNIKVI